MAMTTQGYAALLDSEVNELFEATGEEHPLEYPFLFHIEGQKFNPETHRKITGIKSLQVKTEGGTFPVDAPELMGSKTYAPTSYGLLVEMTKEVLDDFQFDIPRIQSRNLGRSARDREEQVAAAILNNAFLTTSVGFQAGEALIATAHARGDNSTDANRTAGAVTLGEVGLQDANIRYEKQTDEKGLKTALQPRWLVVPPDLKYTARKLLGSSSVPFSANNELNALVLDDYTWYIYHYLTSTTAWFLTAGKNGHDMRVKFRQRPVIRTFDEPRTLNLLISAFLRMTSGFGDWQGTDGNPGA